MGRTHTKDRFIALSPQDFAALGIDRLAYVKRIARDGELRFEIHRADGDAVALLDSQDVAVATILQNGMVPVSVH
jgi:hypothetical protein